jgi:hypothetical protein
MSLDLLFGDCLNSSSGMCCETWWEFLLDFGSDETCQYLVGRVLVCIADFLCILWIPGTGLQEAFLLLWWRPWFPHSMFLYSGLSSCKWHSLTAVFSRPSYHFPFTDSLIYYIFLAWYAVFTSLSSLVSPWSKGSDTWSNTNTSHGTSARNNMEVEAPKKSEAMWRKMMGAERTIA